MFIILKILFFLDMLLKSAFVFLPVFWVFAFMKRKLFKRSDALVLFLMASAVSILWRFVYTVLRDDSGTATRYIATVHIFLIIIAVPGIYAIVEILHKLISHYYKVPRKIIWTLILSAVIITSLAKELIPRAEKDFLRNVGNHIEERCRENGTTKFIIVENVGESLRLKYYSPALDKKIISITTLRFNKTQSYFEEIMNYIKNTHQKYDKMFLFTRGKKKDTTILKDWNLFADKNLNTSKDAFKLIKKYPHRKYYYYIFEFDPDCMKKK